MFSYLQKIGRALMVPVAVLPAAAILMGLGYWIDPAGWGGNNPLAAFFLTSGKSLIDNMPILFAIGVSYGMSRDKDGAAALAGLVGFLVVTTLCKAEAVAQIGLVDVVGNAELAFSKINNQFIGIITGVMAAEIYNRYYRVELPMALAFFSGKRLVPILTAAAAIILSFVLMFVWPVVFGALVSFGESILGLGEVGAGLYAFFNRLLIPFGMHHALNQVFWFDLAGVNDLGNFWAGQAAIDSGAAVIGETGRYMAGFFPIMMFGLPGAALAFYHSAKPQNKAKVASIMVAAAFASFFTGVTEPLEFSFMFVAPVLFVLHAVLTGISVFIAASMQWIAGFAFSAGLIDLVLSSRTPLAVAPFMLVLQGLVFFALYYFSFRAAIKWLNLKTPGREDDSEPQGTAAAAAAPVTASTGNAHADTASLVLSLIGGEKNLKYIDNCATRLRLDVADSSLVNSAEIQKHLPGVLIPSKTSVQVIVGPHVEFVATELKGMTAL